MNDHSSDRVRYRRSALNKGHCSAFARIPVSFRDGFEVGVALVELNTIFRSSSHSLLLRVFPELLRTVPKVRALVLRASRPKRAPSRTYVASKCLHQCRNLPVFPATGCILRGCPPPRLCPNSEGNNPLYSDCVVSKATTYSQGRVCFFFLK